MEEANLANALFFVLIIILNFFIEYMGFATFDIVPKEDKLKPAPNRKRYCFVMIILTCFAIYIILKNFENFRSAERSFYMIAMHFLYDMIICVLARWNFLSNSDKVLAILNEYIGLYVDVGTFTNNLSLLNWKHFLVSYISIQAMIPVFRLITLYKEVHMISFFHMFLTFYTLYFLMIMVFLIYSVSFYDELLRYTRSISKDVRRVQKNRCLESGQLMVLTTQLNEKLAELAQLRSKMFFGNTRLIEVYSFHLLSGFLYAIGNIVYNFSNPPAGYQLIFNVSLELLNIGCYCFFLQDFKRKSKLSRNFWTLHLLDSNAEFDRAVDILLHRELFENVKVAAHGIPLDMRIFHKILSVIVLYVFMKYVYAIT